MYTPSIGYSAEVSCDKNGLWFWTEINHRSLLHDGGLDWDFSASPLAVRHYQCVLYIPMQTLISAAYLTVSSVLSRNVGLSMFRTSQGFGHLAFHKAHVSVILHELPCSSRIKSRPKSMCTRTSISYRQHRKNTSRPLYQ